MTKSKIPRELQPWVEAKEKHRLSQKHIIMARELGMNPKGLGKLSGSKHQPWKLPLPEFIEECYFKRFKKEAPDEVLSFKQIQARQAKKKAESKARKAQARESASSAAELNADL